MKQHIFIIKEWDNVRGFVEWLSETLMEMDDEHLKLEEPAIVMSMHDYAEMRNQMGGVFSHCVNLTPVDYDIMRIEIPGLPSSSRLKIMNHNLYYHKYLKNGQIMIVSESYIDSLNVILSNGFEIMQKIAEEEILRACSKCNKVVSLKDKISALFKMNKGKVE
ncbi:MAG: hypothetical protein ACTSVR_04850 [Candidatus Thorarchaeota archaeon]